MHRVSLVRAAALTMGAATLTLASAALAPSLAAACGCFGQSNPSTPVIQGGERIAFAMQDGEVTAHIQIQYSGAAEDFAWLVPLPSMPTMELGVDELFTSLIQRTQPRYRFDTGGPDCPLPPAPSPPAPDASPGQPEQPSPVVEEGSVGPYEYTVLSAENQEIVSDWLNDNGYFVNTGGDEAIAPYIRPGGFFLALKLRTGEKVGNLQPIVVRYRSELPQIPIVLTSIGAERDMPVLVWMLGQHRAIPRNYHHTHINDALIDWTRNGANYIEVVTAAVDEADGHHSFVTEYAGSSDRMLDVLDPPNRFGDLEVLATITDPMEYLSYLNYHQYSLTEEYLNILEDMLPIPDGLPGVIGYQPTYAEFVVLGPDYARNHPDVFEDAYPDFDPEVLTAKIDERVVTPTLAAGQLFRDHPYMTRLFTTLSPEEMTKDPVFSFNPDLPEVSNIHNAQVEFLECSEFGGFNSSGPAILTTEQGWRLFLPDGLNTGEWRQAPLPASYRIEILREEGDPEVMVDNGATIEAGVSDYLPVPNPAPADPDDSGLGGCDAGVGLSGGAGLLLFGLWGVTGGLRRRRRA
ncbi:MAG: hypothetical protein Tsb0020_33120 [Haliangiales bacterium]